MNTLVNDIVHDLKEKKLWLVAALLIAVIVAAPFALSKGGNATVSASAPAPVSSADAGPQLELTRSETTGFTKAPRVNTRAIDPFGATPKIHKQAIAAFKKTLEATVKAALAARANSAGTATTTTGGGGDTTGVTPVNNGGSSTPPSSGGTSTPAPTTPTVQTVKDDVIDVVVTPDDDTQAKEIDDVRTLSPLPDADNPFLVYVGKTGDDQAQFIVASNATATGDGTCSPSVNDCSTLTLAVGQTEKFTVTTGGDASGTTPSTVAHYSITLVDLQTKKVPVSDGTDTTAAAARAETRLRGVGARVVEAALVNPSVVDALIRNHVTIRP